MSYTQPSIPQFYTKQIFQQGPNGWQPTIDDDKFRELINIYNREHAYQQGGFNFNNPNHLQLLQQIHNTICQEIHKLSNGLLVVDACQNSRGYPNPQQVQNFVAKSQAYFQQQQQQQPNYGFAQPNYGNQSGYQQSYQTNYQSFQQPSFGSFATNQDASYQTGAGAMFADLGSSGARTQQARPNPSSGPNPFQQYNRQQAHGQSFQQPFQQAYQQPNPQQQEPIARLSEFSHWLNNSQRFYVNKGGVNIDSQTGFNARYQVDPKLGYPRELHEDVRKFARCLFWKTYGKYITPTTPQDPLFYQKNEAELMSLARGLYCNGFTAKNLTFYAAKVIDELMDEAPHYKQMVEDGKKREKEAKEAQEQAKQTKDSGPKEQPRTAPKFRQGPIHTEQVDDGIVVEVLDGEVDDEEPVHTYNSKVEYKDLSQGAVDNLVQRVLAADLVEGKSVKEIVCTLVGLVEKLKDSFKAVEMLTTQQSLMQDELQRLQTENAQLKSRVAELEKKDTTVQDSVVDRALQAVQATIQQSVQAEVSRSLQGFTELSTKVDRVSTAYNELLQANSSTVATLEKVSDNVAALNRKYDNFNPMDYLGNEQLEELKVQATLPDDMMNFLNHADERIAILERQVFGQHKSTGSPQLTAAPKPVQSPKQDTPTEQPKTNSALHHNPESEGKKERVTDNCQTVSIPIPKDI